MKRILLIFTCLSILTVTYSQKLPLSADSLATGNYKDVLGSFFQLAFDKFTGTEKEIRFTSNPFAVMAKLDTGLLRDTNYCKYRHLRDLNFSFSAKLDSSYKFNGFSSGLKYALVNRRDETVSRVFVQDVLRDSTITDLIKLNSELDRYISAFDNDSVLHKLRDQKTDFSKGKINFDKLDPRLRDQILKLAKDSNLVRLTSIIKADPKFNINKTAAETFSEIKEKINNKLLWTVGITDTTYKDQFMFSNIVLSSDLVKGIDDMKCKDIELNLKAAMQFADDTLNTGRDLKRSTFSFEPGFNFVFKNKNTLNSIFEFKLSGSYYHTFGALYKNEERDRLVLNGTLRFRIYNDIWVPLEIKYDPDKGNVFGFLNVRANFTALGKMARNLTN